MEEINVQEAYEKQQAGIMYLDVRSTPEYEAGHPAGAVHVPLLEMVDGEMVPNEQFAEQVQEKLDNSKPLLVGCKMGGRSARACNVLASLGFADLYNVIGGFDGQKTPAGDVINTGWRDAGLPVEP